MILCNCCGTDNAPMAIHKDYWICDDCVEKYGSYDAAVEAIKERHTIKIKKIKVRSKEHETSRARHCLFMR